MKLDQQAIERMLSTVTNDDIHNIEAILGKGQTNQVFKIKAGLKSYILRLTQKDGDTSRFRKESWCIEQAQNMGIPTPSCLHFGAYKDCVFMLMACVEGNNGEDMPEKEQEIWHQLGVYARVIHSIPVQGYGDKMVAKGCFNDKWSAFVSENLRSLESDTYKRMLSVEEVAHLRRSLISLEQTETFTFGLIHHDLSLNNTIVDEKGQIWLLDWGSAEAHVTPLMDFSEVLYSSLHSDSPEFNAFLEGYGMSKREFTPMWPHILNLRTLTFFDKMRWALDRRPELVDSYTDRLKQTLTS